MLHPKPRSPVTVEDLLRLKRAERPEPEFWARFEAELRQKQLAALVGRRPWWQQLPQLLAPRTYLPIGATAVLAFTLVSLRQYVPNQVNQIDAEVAAEARETAPAVPQHDMASALQAAEPRSLAPAAPVVENRSAPVAIQLSEQLPAETGELVPWSAARVDESPSARSIAANFARLEESEPELVNSLLAARLNGGSSAGQEFAAHAVEMAAVSGVAMRRSRVMAQLADRQFAPDPSAPEVVRERLSRRLGDTEFAGGWTRVGVKADRVSLKF